LIFERLRQRYGLESVFIDIDAIEFGEDYRERIHQALRGTDYLLVLIGSRWLGPLADGRTRIMERNDPVRLEVEQALDMGLRVVPLLIDHTKMPEPSELPPSMEKLTYLNAADVTSGREFDGQMDRVIRFIDRTFEQTNARAASDGANVPGETANSAPATARGLLRAPFLAIALGALLLTASLAGAWVTFVAMRPAATPAAGGTRAAAGVLPDTGSGPAATGTPIRSSRLAEYALAPGSAPGSIAAGPDGALWFTEYHGDKIGRVSVSGVLSEYPLSAGSMPWGIARGPDGALWFAEFSNKIGRLSVSGALSEYPLAAGSRPVGITNGPDGALWFTETNSNKIGRLSVSGVLSEFPLAAGSRPYGIASGPDGALWFTELYANKIGRLSVTGVLAEHPLPAGGHPAQIVSGPDGALWFTENSGHKIGRISTAGALTEYPLAAGSDARGIAGGADGALWFTDGDNNKIGRLSVTGVLSEYPLMSLDDPDGITNGPDGALWFTEFASDRIGRLHAGG
jgi:virginiamycin B lyase